MGNASDDSAAGFSRLESLGYLAYRLAHLFERALDKRLAQHGVNVGQFRVMLILWEAEQVTQTQIAKHLHIMQPTVANTLRRMERDGLITTKADPDDRRKLLVNLTGKGRRLKDRLTAEAQFINNVAVAGLEKSEIDRIRSSLVRLGDALKAEADRE